MSAGTCRDYLADAILADHPAWEVERSPAAPQQVRRGVPYVALWRSDLKPGQTSLELVHEMTVNLYAGRDSGTAAEEELEGSLDALLVTLERLERFTFGGAERAVFGGRFAGYIVTGSITTQNIYKQALFTEEKP